MILLIFICSTTTMTNHLNQGQLHLTGTVPLGINCALEWPLSRLPRVWGLNPRTSPRTSPPSTPTPYYTLPWMASRAFDTIGLDTIDHVTVIYTRRLPTYSPSPSLPNETSPPAKASCLLFLWRPRLVIQDRESTSAPWNREILWIGLRFILSSKKRSSSHFAIGFNVASGSWHMWCD